MSRQLFAVEQGIQILSENGDTGVSLLQGAAQAGSVGTFDDAASVGSVYFRSNGEIYAKYLAGSGTDKWRRLANADDLTSLSFRSEKVVALTGDAAPSSGSTIDLSLNPFSDDDTPELTGSDFVAGESHILYGDGGTPKLMLVSAVSGTSITVVDVAAEDVLSANDVFVVRNYLPDSPNSQEGSALVNYNGTGYVKIGDVNWDFATGINLSSGYTPAAGDVGTNDTVESAIEKLDGNNDNLSSAVGIDSQTASDMGTYTGSLLNDNETVKQNLQQLETYLEGLTNITIGSQIGVTTEVTLDSMLVDEVEAAKWLVTASLDSTPANKKAVEVFAVHNGHASADASNVDETVYAKLRIGNFQANIVVDLSGSGASQEMRLRVSAPSAVSFRFSRIPVEF
jgi:hypothetical protein